MSVYSIQKPFEITFSGIFINLISPLRCFSPSSSSFVHLFIQFLFSLFFFLVDQISQVMFYKLKQKQLEQDEEARKFIEEFGEQAYIERQKLL